jgi:hypothetical protein
MSRAGGHMGVWTGKRVVVRLRDGDSFTAKFLKSSSTRVHFFDHGSVYKKRVKTLTIHKGQVKTE